LAAVLSPAVLAPFGLVDAEDDACIADAVARWLAERNNGQSKEWHQSLRYGSKERAIAAWRARYLQRSAVTSEHFIDRVRAAATRLDGSLRHTLLITDEEREELVELAAQFTGSARYRAEVWLAASRRAVKSIVRHHLRRGVPLDEVTDDGKRIVFAPIAARWMQGWPYGSGVRDRGSAASTPNYVRYRQLLIDARWMRLAHFSPTAVAFRRGLRPPDDLAFQASRYAVRMPKMGVRVRDVGVDANQVRAALLVIGVTMSGRPVGLDEAHHMLWLTRQGTNLRRRYGYRLGSRIDEVAQRLRRALESR
jgi:hypothetical protein